MIRSAAIALGALLGVVAGMEDAVAAPCSAEKRAEILAPATADRSAVRLDCDLTLASGERVTKRLQIVGRSGIGVRLICEGGVIGDRGKGTVNYRKDMISIRSRQDDRGRWQVVRDVLIDGCEVNGAIRIQGLGPHGQAGKVKASSRTADHTSHAQSVAPSNVVLRNLRITGDGRIPVYFSPGVTRSKLLNSRVGGTSASSGVYLDAESAGNEIRGNVFSVRGPREILSIDGSARNVVSGNVFDGANTGGVYVYRNCGEGGTARHQKPEFNEISGNTFRYSGSRARPTIWLGYSSLERNLFLCPQDRGIGFGSGVDDRDFADRNTVTGNTFVGGSPARLIRDDGANNRIGNNNGG